MSQSRLKELREQRATAHAKAVEFLKVNPQTAESRSSYDLAIKEVDSLGVDIKNIERADAAEAEIRAANGGAGAAPVVPGEKREENFETLAKEYRQAFVEVLRRGIVPENGAWSHRSAKVMETLQRGIAYEKQLAEQRDQNEGVPITSHIGTYSGLGFFVPTGFVNALEQATKYFAPLLDGSVITVMDTATGQPLPMPTSNDTTQVATLIGESTQVSEQDVTASQIIFGAWKMTSGVVRVSLELLQDSAFDLEAWLTARFAERWGRGLEAQLTTGAGTSGPTGIITAVLASGATPIIATGTSESTGGSQTGANSIGNTDLVALEHSVDPTYRRGAKYMFHDQTLASFKKILDKYGRPLWQPGIVSGDPDRINGYPYVINQSMAQIAASANTVVFGDLKKFIARRVKDLAVMKLVERYADFGQVGFVSFARIDSQLLDAGTHPINILQQHS